MGSDDETPQERYVRELRKLRDVVSRRVQGLGPLEDVTDAQIEAAIDALAPPQDASWRAMLQAAIMQKQNDELAIIMLMGM